ncbi:energy transducer TonB [Pseudopedobacter beijingensis]|uniref:TonB family protein n=1 Tax=Pseudopedobacter beijingensis TaxID=1207056 RepID=A0ABW4IBF9_9SPHI
MKNLLFTLLFITSNITAQEVVQQKTIKTTTGKSYVRTITTTSSPDRFEFTEVYEDGFLSRKGYLSSYNPFKQVGEEVSFYRSGNIKLKQYKNGKESVGKRTAYYDNGTIREEGEYLKPSNSEFLDYPEYLVSQISDSLGNNLLDKSGSGKVNLTFANGDILRGEYKNGKKEGEFYELYKEKEETYIENYLDGIFISGVFTDKAGKKNSYEKKAVFPSFKGGNTAFYSWLSSQLSYPTNMRRQNIQGKVLVSFYIDKDGKLQSPTIRKGIVNGDELEQEALRVMEKSPKWNPGLFRGKAVRVNYSVPIIFKL